MEDMIVGVFRRRSTGGGETGAKPPEIQPAHQPEAAAEVVEAVDGREWRETGYDLADLGRDALSREEAGGFGVLQTKVRGNFRGDDTGVFGVVRNPDDEASRNLFARHGLGDEVRGVELRVIYKPAGSGDDGILRPAEAKHTLLVVDGKDVQWGVRVGNELGRAKEPVILRDDATSLRPPGEVSTDEARQAAGGVALVTEEFNRAMAPEEQRLRAQRAAGAVERAGGVLSPKEVAEVARTAWGQLQVIDLGAWQRHRHEGSGSRFQPEQHDLPDGTGYFLDFSLTRRNPADEEFFDQSNDPVLSIGLRQEYDQNGTLLKAKVNVAGTVGYAALALTGEDGAPLGDGAVEGAMKASSESEPLEPAQQHRRLVDTGLAALERYAAQVERKPVPEERPRYRQQ